MEVKHYQAIMKKLRNIFNLVLRVLKFNKMKYLAPRFENKVQKLKFRIMAFV